MPRLRDIHSRILITYANEQLRDVVMVLLEMHGQTVMAVARADDAIEAALMHDFDLAVVGITKPAFKGLNAARAIRAARPCLKIAVHTALDEGWVRCHYHELDAVLPNGVEMRTLVEVVCELLRSPRPRAAPALT